MKTKIIFTIMIFAIMITTSLPVYGAVSNAKSATTAKITAPKDTTLAKDTTPSGSKSSKTTTQKPTIKAAAALSGLAAGSGTGAGSVGSGAQLSPLLSESFQTDLATGSARVNIPIVASPGRKNMQPSLVLSYSSNSPNGVCGVGWEITESSIQRSTKKGTPKYDSTDTFVFSSSGSSGDLVLVNAPAGEYRQKIESGFMKYVYDSVNSKWIVYDKMGIKYIFGSSAASRLMSSDNTKTFAWYLDRVEDVYGNAVLFIYEKDAGQVYLSRVDYTANSSVTPALAADKSIVFVYEDGRTDTVHTYRSGWDIQTAKRLKEIQIKVDGVRVWSYVPGYTQSRDTNRSLLTQITLFDASGNSLPPKKFKYQTIQ